MIRAIAATGVVVVALAAARHAAAQTYSWNNASGGNWNVGTNWSGGTVPGSAQNALIDLAGTYTVSLTDNRSITAVTVNQATATLEQSNGDLSATGLFSLQAGTLHLTGGRILGFGGVSAAAGTTINLDGGQLWATPPAGGTAVINSTVNWSSGEIHGPGATSIPFSLNGAVNLIGTGTREFERTGIIDLTGNSTWDAGRLNLGSSSTTLRLAAGATITTTAASGKFILATDPGGIVGPVFDIRGTFIKQGTNDAEFWTRPQVNNNGTIDVQSGLLNMMGPGTHTGVFQVASGATLQFRGGETLNSGTLKVLGTGTLLIGDINATTTVASNVTVNIASTATVRLNSGSLDLPSNANLSPSLLDISGSVAGSRLTIRGTTAPQTLTMTGGEIRSENDSNVTVGGTFTWGAGEINWVKNFTVNGAANFTGTGSRQLFGDTFFNRTSTMTLGGGGTWDAGEVKLNGLAGIVVAANKTLTITTASGDFTVNPPDATAAGGYVSVAGALVKQGTNTATFGRDIDLRGTGNFDIRAGTMVVNTELLDSARYTVASGATLDDRVRVNVWGTSSHKGWIEGEGTVVTPEVRVDYGGRIRPGGAGPGVLTIGGNSFVNISAHDETIGGPPRFVIAATRTGAGTADSSRIAVTGTGKINFNFPGTTRWVDFEIVGTGLQLGETYTLVVATAGGGFQRNTSTPLLGAGYEFPTTDYRLFGNFAGAQDVRLFLSDANTLSLQFTPVPEPAAVAGLGFAGLGLAALLRRRFRRSPA